MARFFCQESRTMSTSLTPASVTAALQTPGFHQNQEQFWRMLRFLFQDHQEKKVWEHLPPDTVRNICEQLHMVMESVEEYSTLQINRNLLYNVYFVILSKVRGPKTVSRLHADESAVFLSALHHLYKTLLQLKMPMPLFGRAQREEQ